MHCICEGKKAFVERNNSILESLFSCSSFWLANPWPFPVLWVPVLWGFIGCLNMRGCESLDPTLRFAPLPTPMRWGSIWDQPSNMGWIPCPIRLGVKSCLQRNNYIATCRLQQLELLLHYSSRLGGYRMLDAAGAYSGSVHAFLLS